MSDPEPEDRARPTRGTLPLALGALPLAACAVIQVAAAIHHARLDGLRLGLAAGLLGAAALLGALRRARRRGAPDPFLRGLLVPLLPSLFAFALLDLALMLDPPLARGLLGILALAAGHALLLGLRLQGARPSLAWRLTTRANLSVAAAGATLFAIEATVAALSPAHPYEVVPDQRSMGELLVPAEGISAVLQPGFAGRYQHPEFPGTRVEINELGFRDAADERWPREEETSVLCLGDSFVFGTGVEVEQTYHWLLEQELEPQGVRVLGAGVPGYGPLDCLAQMRRNEAQLAVDVVVLAITESNDFADNLRHRNKHQARDAEDDAQRDPGGGAAATRRRAQRSLRDSLRGYGRLPYWMGASAYLARVRPVIEGPLIERGLLSPFVATNRILTAMMNEKPSAFSMIAFKTMLSSVDELRQYCESRGTTLIVAVIPASIQADPERFREFVETRRPRDRAGLQRTLLHDTLVRELRRLELPVVDLMPALHAEILEGRACYHQEGHFNAHGHAVSAEALSPVVREALEVLPGRIRSR